jgi:hypothetical protein
VASFRRSASAPFRLSARDVGADQDFTPEYPPERPRPRPTRPENSPFPNFGNRLPVSPIGANKQEIGGQGVMQATGGRTEKRGNNWASALP